MTMARIVFNLDIKIIITGRHIITDRESIIYTTLESMASLYYLIMLTA